MAVGQSQDSRLAEKKPNARDRKPSCHPPYGASLTTPVTLRGNPAASIELKGKARSIGIGGQTYEDEPRQRWHYDRQQYRRGH
jgi:hypothetical protein